MRNLFTTLILTVWLTLHFSGAQAVNVSVRVSAGNDDAEERVSDGGMSRASSDLEISYDSGGNPDRGLQIVGMRFTGLAIPQGATINSAHVEFETDETDAGATNLVIFGEDSDDANGFANNNNNISNRTYTSASVNWSPGAWNTVNELHQTADISTIIKEIVDRPGWVSGNDMVIIIEPGAGCTNINCQRTAESENGEATAAPLLVVDYSVGAGGNSCETFRDNFSSVSYGNQDGSVNWSSDWIETNDNGSPNNGDIQITGNQLQVKDNDRSIARSADLSSYSTATLTFDYQETGFDNAADFVDIEIRTGGGIWQLLQRFAGAAVNSGSASIILDPSFLASDTEVRLITSGALGNNDRFNVDNFQIEACSNGQPTVDSLTTSDTTPVVTGTFDSANSAGGFTVSVNGITYTLGVSTELTNIGDDWSLDLSLTTPLVIGVYDVVATSDDGAGNILSDLTTNELNIVALVCNATFRDEFTSSSFANNDGDTNFSSNWDEYEGTSQTIPEASPNATAGHVRIVGGWLVMNNHTPESQNFPGVERELNLAGFVSATFSFDFITSGGVDVADSFVVMASGNGGASWTVLEDIRGINDITSSRSYDLTPFIASNTKIRLRFNNETASGLGTGCCYGGSPESISIDNINIDAVGPCQAVDHFNINVGAGAANTCTPFNFSVTAEDSLNNPVANYSGTVSITTTTAHGNFSRVTATNNTVPNPDNDDNGSASYTFDILDNSAVTLALANDHAESLTISVSDPTIPTSTSTSSNVTFSDNAFTIIDSDLLVAGDNVPIAGRDHSYQIQMIRKDPVTGCGVATGYTGLKPLKMWRTQDVLDPSPNDPVLAVTSLPSSDPLANNGSITFVNGIADVILATADIGKFTIELADISNTFADITIAGTSAGQTVRPFGLSVTNIIAGATPNPGGDTPGGPIFTTVGSTFSATVSSVLWDTNDDLDNNGVLDSGIYADNAIIPSYAWDTTLAVSPVGFEPSTGIAGTLTNGAILQADFSAGSSTPIDLRYTEVGSFTLQTTATDFLLEPIADLGGDPIVVGRFIPAFFQITATDGMFADTCTLGPSPFTYIGQTFLYDVIHPSFMVSAMNALAIPTVTQNYTGLWAKLDDSNITQTSPVADTTQVGSDGSTLMSITYTQDASLFTITDNGDGTINFEFGNDQFVYDRDANSEVSLFNSAIDLVITDITDLDGVTNTGSFTLSPNSIELRFGRIEMGNIHGSELVDLAMPMFVEYFDASGTYVINSDDDCTNVTTGDLIITDNLSVPGTSTVTVTNPVAVTGDLGITLTAPGAGVDGNIVVSPNLTGLTDWLQYDWDGLGPFDDDPSAIATFGIFTGSDVNIYKLQIYQ